MIISELETLAKMRIDINSVFKTQSDKVNDCLKVDIPIATGDRLSLVIDWTLRPLNGTQQSNSALSRNQTPTNFHAQP